MSEGSARILSLLREYGALERRRKGAGLAPSEYQRWSDLRRLLDRRLSPRDREAAGDRTPMRLRLEFATAADFAKAWIRDLARGGLFVSAVLPAELGTEVVLRLKVADEEELEVPAVVAGRNVADGFSTSEPGMALHFAELSAAQSAALHAIVVLGDNYDENDNDDFEGLL